MLFLSQKEIFNEVMIKDFKNARFKQQNWS